MVRTTEQTIQIITQVQGTGQEGHPGRQAEDQEKKKRKEDHETETRNSA